MSDKPSIIEAITAIKAEVGAVGKGDFNRQQGYNFRGIDAVVNAISRPLIAAGVVIAPVSTSATHGTVEVGKNRTPMSYCTVNVTYRFHGPAGDFIDVTVPGEAMDSGDKAAPKAMSVAYRTALLQTLTLPTDEPDPDSQSFERSAHAEPDVWEQPPPEAKTDQPWMDRFEKRVDEAGTEGELKGLWEELVTKAQRREVTEADVDTLEKLVKNRKKELTEAPA